MSRFSKRGWGYARISMLGLALMIATVGECERRAPLGREGSAERLASGSRGARNPPLSVRETSGVGRVGEVVRSGVPLPSSLGLTGTSGLVVVDGSGQPVPAEFRVLARWNAGLDDASAPIQWLLVGFPVTVGALESARFELVTDGSAGSNPAPPVPLMVSQNGSELTVDTGAAVFRFGAGVGSLFDEVRLADGTVLVSGGEMSARAEATDVGHSTPRGVRVEHSGPLSAVVVVEGSYDLAPVGGGGLGSMRRYVFTAGSPTAIVRQSVAWEGTRGCNAAVCGGVPNAVLVERVRDTLELAAPSPAEVTVVGTFSAPAMTGTVGSGDEARLRQRLRAQRSDALSFEIDLAGSPGGGTQADGGMLVASSAPGAVAVALGRMHRYEPQALRRLADGRLAIDLADDKVWLPYRSGLFARLAVGALASGPDRATLDRQVWAPLNAPLRAWAEAAWFAGSGAVDEFPAEPLPPSLAGYDALVSSVLADTVSAVTSDGLSGLMTFGVYPRYAAELTCSDPTPGESWDELFWCATWTDYHNTLATAPIWAMRSGEVEWLDEMAVPGALRVLHTQIMQCAPGDGWFYCAQSPNGYGAYRSNFNSSHAYFDNLFLYYWLTGDSTVVETVRRGASSMRDYLCASRPAAPCGPQDPPSAQLVGRVASQWAAAFRFVGLAGDDPSYLDDYRSLLGRAATHYYVQALDNATAYGFWGGDQVQSPGTYATDQVWMSSLYDMNNLARLERDTADAPIGEPAVAPSAIQAAWARTLASWASTLHPGGTLYGQTFPPGDGTAEGTWTNRLDYTWSGPRIGGALTGVAANLDDSEHLLWDTGKATLAAVLMRAADHTGEPQLIALGDELTRHVLAANPGGQLGKEQGLFLARLHPAVARLVAARTRRVEPSTEPAPTAPATTPG